MVDFCTSGGSGISESESNLKEICPDSVWLEGKRFWKALRMMILRIGLTI